MRYLSLFSGVEAASQAWSPLGWTCAGFAEIEPFPCKVLRQRWPGVPNLGDVTQITEDQVAALGHLDLIVFGSPCQDLSVAGKQKGLAGARSGLFHTAIRIIGWARQHCGLRGSLWENVPGAFTSNEGRDFAAVVDALAGLEPGTTAADGPRGKKGNLLWGTEGCAVGQAAMVEWGTLDSQWFGVAQRRRRVFAFADFGDWSRRPPVLLEPEGMRGDTAPRRSTGQDVAGALTSSAEGSHLVAYGGNNQTGALDVSTALRAKGGTGHGDFESETFIAYMPARTFGADGGINEHFAEREVCDALHTASGSGNKAPIVVFNAPQDPDVWNEYSGPLDTHSNTQAIQHGLTVRRLTPRECERLQGMADDYTLLDAKTKDGPRYKALGNSMTVNVMAWIGRQIDYAWTFY